MRDFLTRGRPVPIAVRCRTTRGTVRPRDSPGWCEPSRSCCRKAHRSGRVRSTGRSSATPRPVRRAARSKSSMPPPTARVCGGQLILRHAFADQGERFHVQDTVQAGHPAVRTDRHHERVEPGGAAREGEALPAIRLAPAHGRFPHQQGDIVERTDAGFNPRPSYDAQPAIRVASRRARMDFI